MSDFLLDRQVQRLVDLHAGADAHGEAGDLIHALEDVLAAVARHRALPAPTARAPLGTADVLGGLSAIVRVLSMLAEGIAPDLAAMLRHVLATQGRAVDGPRLDPADVAGPHEPLDAEDEPGAAAGAHDDAAADAAVLQAAAAIVDALDPADLADGDDQGDELDLFADAQPAPPVRRALVLVLRRDDDRAMEPVEQAAAIGALDATLSRLGDVGVVVPPRLREDGATVAVLRVDGDDGELPVGMMPGGSVVFDGVLPLVGVDVHARAICVDDEDGPLADDGGLDVTALLDALDADAVLDEAGDVGDVVTRLRQHMADTLEEQAEQAEAAGDDELAARLREVRDEGLEVPRDVRGRPLLEVRLRRQDGGVLDGAALQAARDAALRTLPRFGPLEEVGVTQEPGLTTLLLALADEQAAEVHPTDVAAGTVVWAGTLPFPGAGLVDASLGLPED